MVLDAQRQKARRGIEKYKVTTVTRPPQHCTKECVFQRLRARVAEEAIGVPEHQKLMGDIRFAWVLGHVHDKHIVLSAALGGASCTTCLIVLRWRVQEQPGPNGIDTLEQ